MIYKRILLVPFFVATALVQAQSGNMLVFNGTANDVQVPHVFSGSSFGMEFWFRAAATGSNMSLIVHSDNLGPMFTYSHQVRITSANRVQFMVYRQDLSNQATITSTASVTAGQWYHVSVSWTDYEGGVLYLDGVLQGEFTGTPAQVGLAWKLGNRVYFGSATDGSFNAFNGNIDEVRFRSGSSNVYSNYAHAPLTSPFPSGVTDSWRFDTVTSGSTPNQISGRPAVSLNSGVTTATSTLPLFNAGAGFSSAPFQVGTAAQVDLVRRLPSAQYLQTANIDLGVSPFNSGTGFTPITFTGVYDGGGFTISNLFINEPPGTTTGLFSSVDGASAIVRNVHLRSADVRGRQFVGTLAGQLTGGARVQTSSATGKVTGGFDAGGFAGGLVGNITGSTSSVTGSYSNVNRNNSFAGGGLVGQNAGLIQNSYATGRIEGAATNTGGLVGSNLSTGQILTSYSVGEVVPSTGGGLVGANAGTVTNSFWDTQTSTRSTSAAGTGRTSAQMRNQATFTGYNFTDTWNMVETGSYPYLRTNTQSPFPGQLAPPQLSVSASSLDFGTRNVFTSTDLTLTLTNTAAAGSMPLTVSSILVTGTGYSVSPGSGSVASGNGTLPVTITFAPTTAGTFTGSVTVTHNAAGSPTVISLTGNAIAAPVISSISPASAAIGSSVTLSGQGFSSTPANNVVWFGGVRATVTAASATSLTVTVPLGAGFGPVSVTVDGKTGQSTGAFSTTFFTSDVLSSSSFPGIPIQRPYLEANESRSRGSSVIADFDGDGKLDLAVAAPSSDNTGGVDLYRNIHANGPLATGSFASRTRITIANIGLWSGRILIADIDSDGKMDMVFANATGSTGILTVLRNTSTTGAFSFTQHDISTGFPTNVGMSTSLALGDVDGDGKPDIALSGYNNALFYRELRTFRNTSTPGVISFEVANGFAMSWPEDIVLGDVDGDGKADLVATFFSTSPLTSQVQIYRSTSTPGNVSYATGLNLTLSTDSPNRLALGDLNRDGLPEVIVKLRGSALNVFPNQSTIGNLSFGTRQSYESSNEFGASLTVADLNGDGRPEVIETISGNSSANISIYPNTGSGSTVQLGSRIQYSNQNPSDGAVFGVNSLAVGDLDGDGKTDFITPSSSNIALFDNRMGTAGFQASSNPLDMGHAARNTTKQVTLTIQNPGTGSLTISSVTVSGTGFSITPTTATIPAGGSGNFTVSALFANAGTYNGSLTFNHNAPSVSTVIPVSVIAITSPLAAPTASAATDISFDGFTANWSAVATAAGYQLDVSTQSNFSSFLSGYEARSVSGTSLAITGLTMSTTYYYRVRTVDLAGGISPNSSTITAATISQFAGGAGTTANPFQVATAAQLNNVRNFPSSHFVQTANISLSGYTSGTGWVPISKNTTAFTGTYNGQNFTISNLTLSGNLFYAGLFGYVSGASAVIENVRLTSTAINGNAPSEYVGALVGLAQHSASIRGSSVAGTVSVSSGQYIGGLVGSLDRDAILATSYSTATVSGARFVGGLVGYSYSAVIRNVYSSASVTASGNYAGGVAGVVDSGTFENSYSIATVTGSQRGLLAGFMGPSSSGGLYFSNASGIPASGQGGTGGALSLTPDQLLVQASFSGWDFSTVWQMESDGKASFPFLRGPVQSPAPGFTSTPRVPVVTVPLASATGVVLRPEFTWEAALAANRYDLQVSRSASFAVLDVNQSNLTSTSFTPASNLQRGLVYHWRVRSRSTVSNEQSAWSDVRTFTTEMLVSAVPGFAMRFDGTNDFATLPGVTDLSGNEITIEFWFKGSNPQSAVRHQAVSQHYIVSTWGGAPPYSPVLSNDGLTANTIPYGFSNDGNWNHFAMTWKRNTTNGFKTYLNGILVGQRNSADAILPNINAALTLGSFNGANEFMNGTLDEVRIWQVERSAAQIRETMYQVLTTPQPGLRAFANFKEGSGSTSDDGAIVLNNFNGTASSGWVASTVPVGGSTASATAFTSGSTTLSGLGVDVTDAFDQASDVVVTRFDMAPAAVPTVSGLEFHTDSYWLTRVFGQPGTWSATLTFPMPTSFTLNGSLPNRRYRLYHRAAGSDGAWTQIAAEASANSATSVSFSGINQTGQFIVARSEAVSLASVDVTELDFGGVVVGMGKTLSVTFTNTGDLPITVSNIAVSGDAFSRTGSATASVAVGASLTIPIAVNPTQAGTLSGSLSITHSASGSPSTITLSANALPAHAGNAMSFSGQSGQYVLLTDAGHPTTYTIELWFKPQVIENMGLFVRTDNGGPSGSYSHALRLNSDGRFEHYTFDGRPRSTFSTTVAQPGRWYHLTAVYRINGDVALYVNGVEEGVNSANHQSPWTGGTAYWIGATAGAHGMAKGEMDEVRLWFDTARSPAEIQSAMHQTLTTASGLRWNLRFDEASGHPVDRATALTATLMGAVPRIASTAPVQAPVMVAPSASLAFGVHTSALEPTAAQSLSWSNNGSQAMTVTRSSTGVPEGGSWFTVTPSQLTVAPGQTETMDVRFAPTSNQRREETLRFDTNAEPVSVQVAANGTGAILPSTWNTNPGTSLSASTSTQISIPFDAALNPATFTLELWVRPQSGSTQIILQSATHSNGYRLWVDASGRWTAWFGTATGGVHLPGPLVAAGAWTHLALVRETDATRFYVNGRLAGQSAEAFVSNTSAGFQIGDGNQFAGLIDELRLWSVARSMQDIQTWMHQPATGTMSHLVLHLPFDEGSGVAVFDRTSAVSRYALIDGTAAFATEVAPAGSFINGSQDAWYFLANPTAGVTLSQFLEPLWTQGAIGSDAPGAPGPNVFTLNETLGTYQAVTNLNVPAVPGKGYLVRVFKNDVYQVDGSFPKRLSVPRAEAPATVELPVSYTPTHAFAGFSLVGNPYPYSIDLTADNWEFGSVAPTVYVYDQLINNYRTWNRSTGTASNDGSALIAPNQGFLVMASASSPTARVPRAARASIASALLKTPASAQVRLDLTLSRGDRQEQMQVLLMDEARVADVRYMTRQLEPLQSDRFMIYAVDPIKGLKIETFERSLHAADLLELPVHAEISTEGENLLRFSISGDLSPDVAVILLDTKTGTRTDLRATPSYVFTGAMTNRKAVLSDSSLTALVQTMSAESARFRLLVGAQALLIPGDELPAEVALAQNYPNPFNPSTVIGVQLPTAGQTRLTVYDILGREVDVLIDGPMSAGRHQVTFNAAGLAGGVYVYRLQVDGMVLSRKMTLLK